MLLWSKGISPAVALAGVRSKVVVLLLLIHCLLLLLLLVLLLHLLLWGCVFGPCFVMQFLVFFLVLQSSC